MACTIFFSVFFPRSGAPSVGGKICRGGRSGAEPASANPTKMQKKLFKLAIEFVFLPGDLLQGNSQHFESAQEFHMVKKKKLASTRGCPKW